MGVKGCQTAGREGFLSTGRNKKQHGGQSQESGGGRVLSSRSFEVPGGLFLPLRRIDEVVIVEIVKLLARLLCSGGLPANPASQHCAQSVTWQALTAVCSEWGW